MLSVIMLNVIMLNVIMLIVIMLNVIMLSVITLNVAAPKQLTCVVFLFLFMVTSALADPVIVVVLKNVKIS